MTINTSIEVLCTANDHLRATHTCTISAKALVARSGRIVRSTCRVRSDEVCACCQLLPKAPSKHEPCEVDCEVL
jgi:hypothetical protein